jgi:hypothetical protein
MADIGTNAGGSGRFFDECKGLNSRIESMEARSTKVSLLDSDEDEDGDDDAVN